VKIGLNRRIQDFGDGLTPAKRLKLSKSTDEWGWGSFEGRLRGRAHLGTATGQGILSRRVGWRSVMALTVWV